MDRPLRLRGIEIVCKLCAVGQGAELEELGGGDGKGGVVQPGDVDEVVDVVGGGVAKIFWGGDIIYRF